MNTETLQIIGISQEELQEKLIQSLGSKVMSGISYDEDGDPWTLETPFGRKLRAVVQAKLDEAVNTLAEKHITPILVEKIESLTMQTTNQWGEKTGSPVTFVEYLTNRAEKYMTEEVDSSGRSQEQCKRSSNSFYGIKAGRMVKAIDDHLSSSIQSAMQSALKDANSQISQSMADACKLALDDVRAKLKVTVK